MARMGLRSFGWCCEFGVPIGGAYPAQQESEVCRDMTFSLGQIIAGRMLPPLGTG